MEALHEELYQVQKELTKKIFSDPEKTLPALIFSTTGRLVCKITGRKTPLPWQFNFIVLSLAIQIPPLLLTLFFNESDQWNTGIDIGLNSLLGLNGIRLGVLWMGYIELGLFATVLGHVCAFYVYKTMSDFIVDTIHRPEDLIDLQSVFEKVGSFRNAAVFTLAFTLFWSFSFSWFLSNQPEVNRFIGYGLFSGTVIFGLLTGPSVYLEGCYYLFITHLGKYMYKLNETSPAHSQVIYRISRIISVLIYSISIFIAFATATVGFNTGAVILAALIGWVPTIIYFFASQRSIGSIIISSKWSMLNRIQEQIRILNSSDITNKENIEAIVRLMDYHERIRNTPNSTWNFRSGLNLMNQLALPTIGLFIANIDKLKGLF